MNAYLVIFAFLLNLQCLCNETLKCCSKFFLQIYMDYAIMLSGLVLDTKTGECVLSDF